MNNQVKPTDTRKLLDWIGGNWEMERTAGTRESSVRAEMWHEFYNKVVSGDLASDTPPVPTIKPGDKVRHKRLGMGIVDDSYGNKTIAKFYDGLFEVLNDDLEVVE